MKRIFLLSLFVLASASVSLAQGTNDYQKWDVTAHFKNQAFVDKFTPPGATQTEGNRERLWNFLGGVQIKDNRRDARLKPFGRALAGMARYTNRSSQTIDLFPQFNFVINDR